MPAKKYVRANPTRMAIAATIATEKKNTSSERRCPRDACPATSVDHLLRKKVILRAIQYSSCLNVYPPEGSRKAVALNRDVVGKLTSPGELVSHAVCGHLDPLTLDALPIGEPW